MTDTKAFPHSIGLTSVGNARELGGYKTMNGKAVKHGIFLRTAMLSRINEKDIAILKDSYRLEKMIDLRSDEEISGSESMALFTGTSAPEPDPEIEGVRYLHLPVLDMDYFMKGLEKIPLLDDMVQMLAMTIDSGLIGDDLYFNFLDNEPGKSSFRTLFKEILSLEDGRSVLFHCTQGKDRTGVAAMLILTALGVSEEVITQDYLLTNKYNKHRIDAERKMLEASDKVPPEKIDTFLMAMDRVNEFTMTNVISHIKASHGSMLAYINRELGITDEEIKTLRERFTE